MSLVSIIAFITKYDEQFISLHDFYLLTSLVPSLATGLVCLQIQLSLNVVRKHLMNSVTRVTLSLVTNQCGSNQAVDPNTSLSGFFKGKIVSRTP